MTFIVLDSFAKGNDIICKGCTLGGTFSFDLLASFGISLEVTLKSLELTQILILNLRVLDLYNIEFLLVLFAWISEPGSEIVSLLSI